MSTRSTSPRTKAMAAVSGESERWTSQPALANTSVSSLGTPTPTINNVLFFMSCAYQENTLSPLKFD